MATLFEGHGWRVDMEEAPLPDGRIKKVARAHRADSTCVIAFVDDSNILLLREFRPFYGEYIWMLPGGRADKGDDATAAAQRELQEEAGYKAGSLRHLWTVNVSESIGSSNHIFLARDLTPSSLEQDDDELIEVHQMTLADALEKVHASPKVHLPSAYALLRYLKENSVLS